MKQVAIKNPIIHPPSKNFKGIPTPAMRATDVNVEKEQVILTALKGAAFGHEEV